MIDKNCASCLRFYLYIILYHNKWTRIHHLMNMKDIIP